MSREPAGRFAAYPGLSGRRLWREIAELGYCGGDTAVTDFLREACPPPRAGFELRFETPPGGQAQADFAQFKVTFDDEPGRTRAVWLFSMILAHSRWLWGRFCAGQNLPTVLRCQIADGGGTNLFFQLVNARRSTSHGRDGRDRVSRA